MSTVAFIRQLLSAGLSLDDVLRAAEVHEAMAEQQPKRSKGAERQARYRERHQASQTVTGDASDGCDASPPPSLPPSPRPPTTHTPTPGGVSTHTRGADEFDGFWAAYPERIGKKAARKAWDGAKDRPPLAQITAAIGRYVRSKPPDRPYCNPATWLNQGRWADEPTQTNLIPMRPQGHDNRNPPSRRQASIDHSERVAEGVLERRERQRLDGVF